MTTLVTLRSSFLEWYFCRNFWSYGFPYEKCPEIIPRVFGLDFVGQKEARRTPAKFPARFPCKKQDFCRCAGRGVSVGQPESQEQANPKTSKLSGPVLRESPRDYLSDTPLACALWGFLVSQHGQFGAIPPPPFLTISLSIIVNPR